MRTSRLHTSRIFAVAMVLAVAGSAVPAAANAVPAGLPVPAAVPAAVEEATPSDCELRSAAARDAARPEDLAERYGYAALHREGHNGRGLTAAQLQFGQSLDVPRLRQFESCLRLGEVPVTQLHFPNASPPVAVEPGDSSVLPAPGREAQSDAEMIVSSAPGLDHLYVLVADSEDDFYGTLTNMLTALQSGAVTGGRAPDIVSLSYGGCEAELTVDLVASTDAALEALATGGTWFFKGSGDSGSTDCAAKAVCETDPQQASVHYPASSEWVTAVGGVEVRSPQPEGRRATGLAEVWNSRLVNPDVCSGGGGGTSTLYPTPAFQAEVPGGAVPAGRGVPDIAALASTPGLLTLLPVEPASIVGDGEASAFGAGDAGTAAAPALRWAWGPNGGDSLSGPLMAGAFASLRSALIARGAEVPTLLNPVLYRVANDGAVGPSVFRDVTVGSNDLYDVGCCSATPGYDLASGLGEVDLAALLEALAPVPPPVRPAFTG